jgi:ABC-type antimicrobial peptide transport system permease subunit
VAIVNRTMAQYFWPGENAVGKTVYDDNRKAIEIVGVVSDFHRDNNIDIAPAIYRPETGTHAAQKFIIRLRSNASLASFRSNVRRQLSGLDTEVRLEVRTLLEQASALADHRLSLLLISCFALLGIVVSGLGVYATSTLMEYSRNREIGIRMAAGAQYSDILRLILLRSARVLLIGLPCGLFLGWVLTSGLSSVVFQVKSNDLAVWIISCAAFLGIATVAALVPALRAARINPAHVLRSE